MEFCYKLEAAVKSFSKFILKVRAGFKCSTIWKGKHRPFPQVYKENRVCDGIVLVFAHEETVCHLMKALADAGHQEQATRDLAAVVKGYCIMEPVLRTDYLRNMDADHR